MIEIYHFRNRFGKQCVAVFGENRGDILNLPDFVREYHAGMDPPDFNLPVPMEHTLVFETKYMLFLFHKLGLLMREDTQ